MKPSFIRHLAFCHSVSLPLLLAPLATSSPYSRSTEPAPNTPPTATLSAGAITGKTTSLPAAEWPVNQFLGIRYAEKPERFKLAKPKTPWEGVHNTTGFGSACLQNFGINQLGPGEDLLRDVFDNPPVEEDEDCLTINVFAPAGRHEDLPVVVFIPGGGWQIGSGRIDLSGFAAYEGIVAVTFNYRTNIFGFPASPSIPAQERNLGLHDQRLALTWVQSNIRSFGGSPSKVTIWGESAGSMSVELHLRAFADTTPPFRGAIMASGQMSIGFLSIATPSDDAWLALALLLGCAEPAANTTSSNSTSPSNSTAGSGSGSPATVTSPTSSDDILSCMSALPAQQIKQTMLANQIGFGPSPDNVTLLSHGAEAWRQGRVAHVPVMTGTVAEEGRALVNRNVNMTLFLAAYLPEPLFTAEQREMILETYQSVAGLETDFDVAAAIYTDYFWKCPQSILANLSSTLAPTWRYYFNASVVHFFPDRYDWLGIFHGSDNVLLFSNASDPVARTQSPDASPHTAETHTLLMYFRSAIARFVRNPAGGPGWPAIGSSFEQTVAVLGDVGDVKAAGATMVERGGVDTRCEIWEEIYPLVEGMTA